MAKDMIHFEASRNWWSGTSRTLCGLTITEITSSGWFLTITCPTCKQLNRK